MGAIEEGRGSSPSLRSGSPPRHAELESSSSSQLSRATSAPNRIAVGAARIEGWLALSWSVWESC
jgi:hypothetical protein